MEKLSDVANIVNESIVPFWSESECMDRSESDRAPRVPRRHFRIGKKFGDLYFTFREAQCMAQIMRGKTIKSTAHYLGLSPRTVEYYLKNMKSKLKCRTKSELMQIIADSDFMKEVREL